MWWQRLILLLVIFTSFIEGYEYIGSPCEYDDDCEIQHTFCKMQRDCRCKKGFKPTDDSSNCIATVGAMCRSSDDCSSLPNSACIDDTCSCVRGYTPDSLSLLCLQVADKYRSTCNETHQCTPLLGDLSICGHNKSCICQSGSHYDNTRCFHNAGLGEHCQNKSSCYINDKMVGRLDCIHNRCECGSGYNRTKDNMCGIGLSTQISWNVLASVLLLWAILKYNMN